MNKPEQTPSQKFDAAIASTESKLALAEMVEQAKKDNIVKSFEVQIPNNFFDSLEEE